MRHKQTLTRKNASLLSRSCRHKLRKFFVMTMGFGLILIGCVSGPQEDVGQKEDVGQIKVIAKTVELDAEEVEFITKGLIRGLKINDSEKFKVLFAVNKEGRVITFVGATPTPLEFPFEVTEFKEIKNMTTITVFALNPTYCWTNTAGDPECVTW